MSNNNIAVLNKRSTWQEVMKMDTTGATSNFYLHFSPGFIGDIYRKRPVFQRLNNTEPDLVQRCLDSGRMFSEKKDLKEKHYQTIFPAYRFMEQNVHLTDPGVVDKDGKIDMNYLFR